MPSQDFRTRSEALLRSFRERTARLYPGFRGPVTTGLRIAAAGFVLLAVGFAYSYVRYSRVIDESIKNGPFPNTVNIFAAPTVLRPGTRVTRDRIVAGLTQAGYTTDKNNRTGYYRVKGRTLEIFPGPNSYFRPVASAVEFSNQRVKRIVSLKNGEKLSEYQLEPRLIANVSRDGREKRQLVRYEEIPPVLKQAILSIEDKRFFEHIGFDPVRIGKAAYVDLREGRKEQGASTISMQLARNLFLKPDKSWLRKLNEFYLSLVLEWKLPKEKIFEAYVNQVYLGFGGSYNVHGFGQASHFYFGKKIGKLTLPDAALLAGILQAPSYYNPVRHPQRALERRNLVLELMHDNGFIDDEARRKAAASPLEVSPRFENDVVAPHFVDLIQSDLNAILPKDDILRSVNVYTALDMELQQAAEKAVRDGIVKVDRQAAGRMRDGARPEAALVALDPRTGAVKALVGGRDYRHSQYNRALALRQPGSTFKPFVYAAALNSGGGQQYTPASLVEDSPVVIEYDDKVYEPKNYDESFHGTVTLRRALARSFNAATVSLAQQIGYQPIVDLARDAGMNANIQPTPSVALGAYDVTPVELAGAFTVFANQGVASQPYTIAEVRTNSGRTLHATAVHKRPVLDPRVSYLMVNMLEEVIDRGTAARVRSSGLRMPAAGKTGTSRDGWFVGFTPELLTVVWVGFDDNRDLELTGSQTALPIWINLMKSAQTMPAYGNAGKFPVPPGVVTVQVDPSTGLRAASSCPQSVTEVFIAGTEPTETCTGHDAGAYSYQAAEPLWDSMDRDASNSYVQPPAGQPLPAQDEPLAPVSDPQEYYPDPGAAERPAAQPPAPGYDVGFPSTPATPSPEAGEQNQAVPGAAQPPRQPESRPPSEPRDYWEREKDRF